MIGTLCLVLAQLALPRRYAFVPLIVATLHISRVPIIFDFSAVRLVVLVGILRSLGGRYWAGLSPTPLDRLVVAWAIWAALSALGHEKKENYNPVTVHIGLAIDYLGAYYYARFTLTSKEDLIRFAKCLTVLLVPFGALLSVEKITGENPYAILGAIYEEAWVREGRVRAAGPFGNAILAGTVGGVCLPLVMLLRKDHPRYCLVGGIACAVAVFCSASSGPVISFVAGGAGLILWRWRDKLGMIQKGALAGILTLALVMEAPVWYLVARVDLAGGSTSWHRAELITEALNHIGEWWLIGTDYTRHWLPYGIQWSEDHVDITNHYLFMGVRGGLPLLLVFIAILGTAFRIVGRQLVGTQRKADYREFVAWCVGCSLFVHVVTFMGVSYFDQSYVLLCLTVGAVPALTNREASTGI